MFVPYAKVKETHKLIDLQMLGTERFPIETAAASAVPTEEEGKNNKEEKNTSMHADVVVYLFTCL